MKFSRLFTLIISCVLVFIILSTTLSGCAAVSLINKNKIDNVVSNVSSVVSVDKTPEISAEEYVLLDGIARSLYYVKFNSPDDLNDQMVREFISSILHDQDLQSNDYLITPQRTNAEYKLEADKCKAIAKGLFNYDLGDGGTVAGNYIFPYAGGVTPQIAGKETHPLEDGSFRLVYTVQAQGFDGGYIINDIVTLNVIRIESEYSKFRILSIMSQEA